MLLITADNFKKLFVTVSGGLVAEIWSVDHRLHTDYYYYYHSILTYRATMQVIMPYTTKQSYQ